MRTQDNAAEGHGDTAATDLADRIIEALESGRSGAVRDAVAEYGPLDPVWRERMGTLRAMAEGLDPPMKAVRAGFVTRVMAEIRGEQAVHRGAYDRLPPLWQMLGAGVLFVALAAVVLATGASADSGWQGHALTGFLERALVFLGALSHGIRQLWDAVVPGRGLPILIGCAAVATLLNVAFAVRVLRRRGTTIEED